MRVKIDGYTRFLLTAITILLTFVTVGLWYETPSTVPTVQAQIPDAGAQMADLVKEVENINKSLSTLPGLLTSGKVKVQVTEAAEQSKSQKKAETVAPPAGK